MLVYPWGTISCNYIAERKLVAHLNSMDHCLVREKDRNKIWNNFNGALYLRNIAKNKLYSNKARFLAAEILFGKDKNYPPKNLKKSLAYVYANALLDGYNCSYNNWGYPFATTIRGLHFVRLGSQALPSLISLLNNNKRILFDGSSNASLSNRYHFRIKDMAAVFISHICHIEFKVYHDVAKRDKQIERIKRKLTNGTCKPRKFSELNIEPVTHDYLRNDIPDENLHNNK